MTDPAGAKQKTWDNLRAVHLGKRPEYDGDTHSNAMDNMWHKYRAGRLSLTQALELEQAIERILR